jgi:hypothetical protein
MIFADLHEMKLLLVKSKLDGIRQRGTAWGQETHRLKAIELSGMCHQSLSAA